MTLSKYISEIASDLYLNESQSCVCLQQLHKVFYKLLRPNIEREQWMPKCKRQFSTLCKFYTIRLSASSSSFYAFGCLWHICSFLFHSTNRTNDQPFSRWSETDVRCYVHNCIECLIHGFSNKYIIVFLLKHECTPKGTPFCGIYEKSTWWVWRDARNVAVNTSDRDASICVSA